jgi:phosphoribosylformimino-5-aminoimidazole carboxamide ribonucleotide (ProFAR) isomerase
VPRIQYTDTVRDGTLRGANLDGLRELARATRLRITAGGGIATLDELIALRDLGLESLDEVVVGRALYERRFTLEQAQAALAAPAR